MEDPSKVNQNPGPVSDEDQINMIDDLDNNQEEENKYKRKKKPRDAVEIVCIDPDEVSCLLAFKTLDISRSTHFRTLSHNHFL